jgi:hypothetical protein
VLLRGGHGVCAIRLRRSIRGDWRECAACMLQGVKKAVAQLGNRFLRRKKLVQGDAGLD